MAGVGRVCEIPVKAFMNEFVPGPHLTFSKKDTGKWKGKFKAVKSKKKEAEIYPDFCETVNFILGKANCRPLIACETADWPDKTEGMAKLMGHSSKVRPSISIYQNTPEAARDYVLSNAELEGFPCSKYRKRHLARVSWQHLCVPIELKIDHTLSAFEFLEPEKYSPVRSEDTMEQIADYVSRILLAQHREFCLMVYIFKSLARLVRWDRVGAIVSEPFSYVKGRALQTFFYRVGHMSDAELGYDPTVVAATPAEVKLMTSCRDKLNDYHKQCLDEVMSPNCHIHKVTVYAKDLVDSEALRKAARSTADSASGSDSDSPSFSSSASVNDNSVLASEVLPASNTSRSSDDMTIAKHVRHFLIGRPQFAARSPTGRATRRYIAYDMETGRLVFLKDTWRPNSSKTHPEREVYERLYKHRHDVLNIATLPCGGDVGSTRNKPQRTRTQEFGGSLLGRIHYRLVVKEVGRPFDDHKDCEEMIRVIYCALDARCQAWEKARVLHRDVSIGNILADEDPDDPGYGVSPGSIKGFLNDLDLSKCEDELDSGGTPQKTRSGTWQFMSALLLQFPRKRCEVSDDLESFMHVVNWLALKWYRHHLRLTTTLQQHIADTYNERSLFDGYDVGGHQKLQQIWIGKVPFILSIKGGLSNLLEKLMELCNEHYKTVDMASLKLQKTQPETPQPVPRQPRKRNFAIRRRESNLVALAADKHPAGVSQAPRATLSTHGLIMDAFADVLEDSAYEWVPDKVENQFASFGPVRNSVSLG
ncbi:hypothetical protein BKA93DRAFT_902792 [Sparassis latifolia]